MEGAPKAMWTVKQRIIIAILVGVSLAGSGALLTRRTAALQQAEVKTIPSRADAVNIHVGEMKDRQPGQPKRELTAKDYALWESLGDVSIASDGRWCAYTVRGPKGGRLVVRNLDSERQYEIVSGSSPDFAAAFPSIACQLPGGKGGVLDLNTGKKKLFEGIQPPIESLSGGDFLLVQRDPKAKGSRFELLSLKDASLSTLEATQAVAPSATGRFLALTVVRDSATHIELLDLQKMERKNLYQTKHPLGKVIWAANDEALLTTETISSKAEPREVSVVILKPLTPSPATDRFDPAEHAEFPKGCRLAGPLQPIPGRHVKAYIVQTVPAAAPPPSPTNPNQDNVIVRRGDDPIVQSLFAGRGGTEPPHGMYLWLPSERKLVPLAGEPIGTDFRYVLSRRQSRVPESWNFEDLYLTDLEKKTTTLLADQAEGGSHPFHPVVLYFRKGHWWEYNVNTRQSTNLTKDLPERFDAPTYGGFETPHSCDAEILSDGSMLLTARYDLYLWTFGKALRRLTNGAKDRTVYRLAKREVPRTMPDGTPRPRLLFTAFNEGTKEHGFAILEPDAEMAELKVMRDRKLVLRAKAKDRLLFEQSSFTEPSNLYVGDIRFRELRRVSDLNAHQKDYHWGKAELVSYRSSWGADLGGVLIYPAQFVPGKLYPMVVYVYEMQSDQLHDYVPPNDRDWANEQVWSQRGYIVLKPDIAYQPGKPGSSALDCVEAAISAVLKKGIVDPKRIGLMGTSFGGYETTFILGKSSTFAAGVALNPITNLVSYYSVDSYMSELGQNRMGVPYWQDLQRYVENSPIFHANRINAPLLLVHGDADRAVPWQQSRELYEAMQRQKKKNVTLLIYPGVGHGPFGAGLAQRVRHFFDVHLCGAKAGPWLAP
jgi:dienelactone hydrolase